jgi:Domain of unknown function (DUF4395)
MVKLNQLICPVSPDRVDENRVRATAFGVLIIIGLFFMTKNPVFPLFLVLDFYIRAFTRYKYSLLSWLAHHFVKALGTQPVWIDKAPKMFAARVGLLLASVIAGASLLGMPLLAMVIGATLVLFSFLECGLNFCAGCWVYTYLVYPMVRKKP